MNARLLAYVVCSAMAIAWIGGACTVNRPTDALTCTDSSQCTNNRVCDTGYCIAQNCPSLCTTCVESAHTCEVTCGAGDACASMTCPSGWDCTITCTGGNACNDITCPSGSKCSINCAGTSACGDVQCKDACKCDLTCPSGDCGTKSCPTVGNGASQVHCTTDGTTSTACDSAKDSRCVSC